MKKAAAVIALAALAAAGCEEKANGETAGEAEASPSSTTEVEPKKSALDGKELVELAEGYADAVCACEKSRCSNEAGEKYHADTNALYADKKARKPTPDQRKKMDAAQARVKDCTNKLLGK